MDAAVCGCDNPSMAEPEQPHSLTRVQESLLAGAERRLLNRMCGRLPAWVTPDQLTGLGLASALLIFVAYAMSSRDPAWLWLVLPGLFFNWFGDSLDGSLARYRKIERPAYGYFIDHSCDGLAALLVFSGMGLSPYVRLDVALLVAAGYLLLSIHTFLAAKVTDVFRISQAGLGPTELRLILMALTMAMFFLGPDSGRVGVFSGFDLFAGLTAFGSISVFVIQTLKVGNHLRTRC